MSFKESAKQQLKILKNNFQYEETCYKIYYNTIVKYKEDQASFSIQGMESTFAIQLPDFIMSGLLALAPVISSHRDFPWEK